MLAQRVVFGSGVVFCEELINKAAEHGWYIAHDVILHYLYRLERLLVGEAGFIF